MKKTIIVKSSLKDMQLDIIPKIMDVQHIVPRNMVGDKMTTQNDAEDEHDENERANLASTHDDNNRCKYPLPIPLISNIENPLLATILRFF